jgi:nuclear transport factor 2 (NTF2) superfamily protein
MRGTAAILSAFRLATHWTANGETVPFHSRPRRDHDLSDTKWNRELDYRLIKDLWSFRDNRIAVRFAYEWHDDSGNWSRSFGNENWEFDERGLMRRRIASINDLPISEGDRLYHWPIGRRPDDHPSLSDLDYEAVVRISLKAVSLLRCSRPE